MIYTKCSILFLYICFISIKFIACYDTVEQIHVLFRHGARTPSEGNMYPKDPYINDTWYPDGLGALTKLGKLQEYNIGKKLREAYNKFLGEIYTPNILDARTTDSSRTKMSVELVLASLFPPNSQQQWNKDLLWQPIPYNYERQENDQLLGFPITYCPEYQQEYQKLITQPGVQEFLKKNAPIIRYINENTGLNITTTLELFELYLGLIAEETAGKKLPEWATKVYKSFLKDAASYEYKIQLSSDVLVKATGGPLIKKIINDTREIMNGNSSKEKRKIYLYSGHEYNLAYVLGAMKLFDYNVPPFGAYIIFELHKIEEEYVIKVLYEDYSRNNPNTLKLEGCSELCPFEKFVNATRHIIPDHGWC